METRNWVELTQYPNYEITDSHPFEIRKKCNGRVLKQTLNTARHFVVTLNGKTCYLHRILAEQFSPNPENLPKIDHVNRNSIDNRLENLRWCSDALNDCNRNSMKGVIYEYINELPEGFQPFTEYIQRNGNILNFENLFVKVEDEKPEFITGDSEHQFRRLYVFNHSSVQYHDVEGKYRKISFGQISKSQNKISNTQNGINTTQQGLNQAITTIANTLNTMAETLKTMTQPYASQARSEIEEEK
jgi:hypothetical protein